MDSPRLRITIITTIIIFLLFLSLHEVSALTKAQAAQEYIENNTHLLSNTYSCGGTVVCEAQVLFHSPININLSEKKFNISLTDLDGKEASIPLSWEITSYEQTEVCNPDWGFPNDVFKEKNNEYCHNISKQVVSDSLIAGDNTIRFFTYDKPIDSVVDWNFRITDLNLKYQNTNVTVVFDTRAKGWALWGNGTAGQPGVQSHYWIEDNGSRMWVKMNLTAGESEVFYVNASKLGYAPNGEGVFKFYDGFNASLDFTNKWQSTNTGLYTVSGGNLTLGGTATASQLLCTKNTYSDFTAITRIRSPATSAAYNTYFLAEPAASYSYNTGTDLFYVTVAGGARTIYDTTNNYTATAVVSANTWYKLNITSFPSGGGVRVAADNYASEYRFQTGTSNLGSRYMCYLQYTTTGALVDWVAVRTATPVGAYINVSCTDLGAGIGYKINVSSNTTLTAYQISIPSNSTCLNLDNSTQSLFVSNVTDSEPIIPCTYSGSGTFTIKNSEYCNFTSTSPVDVMNNTLTFNGDGSGRTYIGSRIINVSRITMINNPAVYLAMGGSITRIT